MRDDFPASTIRILADRVNSICSNPSCKASTRGPKSSGDKAVNLGKAAHITAASQNGPRFDPSLSPEERGHFNNGIWLCSTCADLVDADPERFTVDELRKWKLEAETTAKVELGRPKGFSKGRLAVVSSAVPFGTETLVETERFGRVPIAYTGDMPIPYMIVVGETIPAVPTYFESFAFVRRFKIRKRRKYNHVVLEELRAIVIDCLDVPEYRPLYGAYPTEMSLYGIVLKPPAAGEHTVCSATKLYQSTGPHQCEEKNFNSIVLDSDVPHDVHVRLYAEKPGMYVVRLEAIISRGMRRETHVVMGFVRVIFEEAPAE